MSRQNYFKVPYVSMITRIPDRELIQLMDDGILDWSEDGGKRLIEGGSLVSYLEQQGKYIPDVFRTAATHILIVDDEPLVVSSLKRLIMAKFQLTVDTAANGFEMGKMLNSKMPDLVILDYNMPGINGYDVLKQLKSASDTHKMSVIVYSGHVPDNVYYEMKQLNVEAIIQKSADNSELLNTIEKIIN